LYELLFKTLYGIRAECVTQCPTTFESFLLCLQLSVCSSSSYYVVYLPVNCFCLFKLLESHCSLLVEFPVLRASHELLVRLDRCGSIVEQLHQYVPLLFEVLLTVSTNVLATQVCLVLLTVAYTSDGLIHLLKQLVLHLIRYLRVHLSLAEPSLLLSLFVLRHRYFLEHLVTQQRAKLLSVELGVQCLERLYDVFDSLVLVEQRSFVEHECILECLVLCNLIPYLILRCLRQQSTTQTTRHARTWECIRHLGVHINDVLSALQHLVNHLVLLFFCYFLTCDLTYLCCRHSLELLQSFLVLVERTKLGVHQSCLVHETGSVVFVCFLVSSFYCVVHASEVVLTHGRRLGSGSEVEERLWVKVQITQCLFCRLALALYVLICTSTTTKQTNKTTDQYLLSTLWGVECFKCSATNSIVVSHGIGKQASSQESFCYVLTTVVFIHSFGSLSQALSQYVLCTLLEGLSRTTFYKRVCLLTHLDTLSLPAGQFVKSLYVLSPAFSLTRLACNSRRESFACRSRCERHESSTKRN